MFDAKSILDILVGGGQSEPRSPQGQSRDLGELSDLLRQLAGGDRGASSGDAPRRMPMPADPEPADEPRAGASRSPRARPPREEEDDTAGSGQQGGGGLQDILREVLGGGRSGGGAGGGGGLGEILDQLRRAAGQGGPQGGSQGGGGGGGLGDILGEILGGGRGGPAGRQSLASLQELTGGRSPEEIVAMLKDLIDKNQMATGAALGGLGALILGTQTGRALAGTAVKLGGLAVIGGLAYKAYQNYQRGQPVDASAKPQGQALLAAPAGSGFEPAAVSNDHAMLLIRAMIAAAAADGRIDERERQAILGSVQQGGLDRAAQQFLQREIENPASVEDLAAAVSTQEAAVQVYTAARVTVDPDEEGEHAFLAELAERLGIDDTLAAHIDATARRAGA